MRRSSRRSAQGRAAYLQDEMQASMSPGTYIMLLHNAATQGRIPILDNNGNPTGTFDTLDTQERLDTLKYLVNKIVPDAPRLELHADVPAEALGLDEYSKLPTADLLRLVHAEAEPASDTASVA